MLSPSYYLPISYHPHHDVGESSNPQGGGDKGQHEPVLPARRGAVGDCEVQQQAQRPSEQPLELVKCTRCKHTGQNRVLHSVSTEIEDEGRGRKVKDTLILYMSYKLLS